MRIPTMIVMTLATAFSLGNRAASAQTVTCTPITSLPFNITTAGPFCLTGNLSYSKNVITAITIDASGAVLDFNGYRLVYSGTSTSALDGVKVLPDHSGVVIRNGVISDFVTAIEIESNAVIVEDMRTTYTTYAVVVQDGAAGVIIRRNLFFNVSQGVISYGNSIRVIDNDIVGKDMNSYGMFLSGLNAFVVGNRLNQMAYGVLFDTRGTGKYRDNVASNIATTSYSGGTNAGNND